MAIIVPTTPDVIFEGVKAQLINQGVFNATSVFVGNFPDENYLPPDLIYAIITPGRQNQFNPECDYVSQDFTVTIWGFSALDQDVRADQRDQTIIAAIDSTVAALNLYMLPDAGGNNFILLEPMRLETIGRLVEKSGKDDVFWASSKVRFNVKYQVGNQINAGSGSGGLTLGGSSNAGVSHVAIETSGGLRLGGSSAANITKFVVQTHGGLVLGGSSKSGVATSQVASGGLTLGGSAVASHVPHFVASGWFDVGWIVWRRRIEKLQINWWFDPWW